jgi:hypothetical protein
MNCLFGEAHKSEDGHIRAKLAKAKTEPVPFNKMGNPALFKEGDGVL